MLELLAQTWGSLLIGGAVLAVVAAILIKLFRDRKRGKSVICSDCGGSCAQCPSAGACHRSSHS